MVTGTMLLIIFALSIAFLLITIMKFKMNAFISLLLTSVLTALSVKMPLSQITDTIATGFANTVGGIGTIFSGMGVGIAILFGIIGIAFLITGIVLIKIANKEMKNSNTYE